MYHREVRPFRADGLVLTQQWLEVVGLDGDIMICRGHDMSTLVERGTSLSFVGVCVYHTLDGEIGEAVVQGFAILTDEVADMESI